MSILHQFPSLSLPDVRSSMREEDDDNALPWNPFELPLVLLNMAFVKPFERVSNCCQPSTCVVMAPGMP